MQSALSSLVIFVLFCHSLICESKQIKDNDNHQADYLKIDKYLTEKLKNDYPELNMEQVGKWLEKQAKPLRQVFKKKDDSLVDAFKQLQALKSIVGFHDCNRNGYEILQANILSSGAEPLFRWSRTQCKNRVEALVRYYAREHAKSCMERYPVLLFAALKKLPQLSQSYVETLVEKRGKASREDDHGIYDTIMQLSGADKASLKGDKSKVEELFNEYVAKPCGELNEKVGSEYLRIIEFDRDLSNPTVFYGNSQAKRYDLWFNVYRLLLCDELKGREQEALARVIKQVESDD